MSNYHDPRQPEQFELDEIARKFYIKDGRLWNVDYNITVDRNDDGKGYAKTWATSNKVQREYRVHHIFWFLYHGEWPKHQIDHRDTNKQNNTKYNLRYANSTIQQLNKKRKLDLPPGVTYHKKGNAYSSEITFQRKRRYLGRYTTAEAAHAVYKEEYKKCYGVELDV